jgi:pSer/pThr/pTyr-binding forkhead associated (FHA) protein
MSQQHVNDPDEIVPSSSDNAFTRPEGQRRLGNRSLGMPVSDPPQGDPSDTACDLATVRFRPLHRPPLAVLWVMDDDQDGAERIRIRQRTFVIGRTEGDLCLPHDHQISSRHAEISRRQEEGAWNWYLTDLKSTNGTFVKIAKARLQPETELCFGCTHFRFRLGTSTSRPPHLVQLLADGEGRHWPLDRPSYWFGRDAAQCQIFVEDDPTISPTHAHLQCDDKGRWYVLDDQTLNGTWLRIEQIRLTSGGEFELGEQRFRIVLP